MTNRVVITIELPDGVVPDVQYSTQPAPAVTVAPPSVAASGPESEFSPFPSQASSPPFCKVHNKPMKAGRNGGWFCPTKVGDGPKDWCQEKA